MRKRDCEFLLNVDFFTATYRMTFTNQHQRMEYLNLRALTTNINKWATRSRVTEPKFSRLLSDVKESSAVLTQQSTLPYSHPLLNASAQNEDGVCQFSPTRATNRLPLYSSVSWASLRNRNLLLRNRLTLYIFWKFGEDNSGIAVETSKTFVFWLCVHPATSCKVTSE